MNECEKRRHLYGIYFPYGYSNKMLHIYDIISTCHKLALVLSFPRALHVNNGQMLYIYIP